MGMEIEYQNPSEVWSDLDSEGNDFFSLSSDTDKSSRCDSKFEHLAMDLSDDDFSLVTPQTPSTGARRYLLHLDCDDVNMDRTLDESHADGSPDASVSQICATRIESLSPPVAPGYLTRPGTAEMCFPGLSTKQTQAAAETSGLDGELNFDSESDSGSELHDLEEFGDVTGHPRGTSDVAAELLEHQVSNGSRFIGTEVGVDMDGMDEEDLYFGLEDW
ncbi:hypothetical protein FB451DRAFT_555995 [Mycena latifolia]|nr:hypothetical protein FB451DRAFT_555995 [Mycena latifolia]